MKQYKQHRQAAATEPNRGRLPTHKGPIFHASYHYWVRIS